MDNLPTTNTNPQPDAASKPIDVLIKDMLLAFGDKNFELTEKLIAQVNAVSPNNPEAQKITKKLEKAKLEQEKQAKASKLKEYAAMLNELYKKQDLDKLFALTKELKDFDQGGKTADAWFLKIEKLSKKLNKKLEGLEAFIPEKKSFFSSLFSKSKSSKNDEVEKLADTPGQVDESKGLTLTNDPTKIKTSKTGNTFTKMFAANEPVKSSTSVIDQIVAKTDKKEVEAKKEEKPLPVGVSKKKKKLDLFSISKLCMNFTILFIALSGAYLYVEFVDVNNTFLSVVGFDETTGSRLHNASESVGEKTREEARLKAEVQRYEAGYDDGALNTVGSIIDNRVNWPDVFSKINEVTNSVYELNDFFRYIEYNNYTFNAANGTIGVSGTLSDPLGQNLTRLVELEEAFLYYPRDPNNPEDTTEPYFTGFREFLNFSKELDETTGRYNSSFQLSFNLNSIAE